MIICSQRGTYFNCLSIIASFQGLYEGAVLVLIKSCLVTPSFRFQFTAWCCSSGLWLGFYNPVSGDVMTVTMMDSNVSERGKFLPERWFALFMLSVAGFVVVDRNGDGPRSLNEDCVINDCIPMQSMSTNGLEDQLNPPRPHLLSFNVPDNDTYMRWSISSFMRFTGLLTCPQVYCFALLVSRHYFSFMNTILRNAAPANNTSCPTAASRSNPPSHHLLELKNEVLRKHRMALYFASSTLW